MEDLNKYLFSLAFISSLVYTGITLSVVAMVVTLGCGIFAYLSDNQAKAKSLKNLETKLQQQITDIKLEKEDLENTVAKLKDAMGSYNLSKRVR